MNANGTFKDLIYFFITDFIQPATYLILGLAVVYFMWNITMVIKNSDNPEELGKFKDKAVWGVVAIFVMISLWGLVAILTNTFFGSSNLIVPTLKPSGSSGSSFERCPAGQVVDPRDSTRCIVNYSNMNTNSLFLPMPGNPPIK